MFAEIACCVAVSAMSASVLFWATSFRFVCPGGACFLLQEVEDDPQDEVQMNDVWTLIMCGFKVSLNNF